MMKRICAAALSLVCLLALTACSRPADGEPAPYAPSELSALAEAGAFSEELETLDGDTAFALYRLADYGLDRADLTDCAVLRSSGATCEEAAILVFSSQEKAQAAMEALEAYLVSQIESNRDYRPDEIPKLEQSAPHQIGNTVLLLVAGDPEAAAQWSAARQG